LKSPSEDPSPELGLGLGLGLGLRTKYAITARYTFHMYKNSKATLLGNRMDCLEVTCNKIGLRSLWRETLSILVPRLLPSSQVPFFLVSSQGSFASFAPADDFAGAMMSVSLIAVPVMLDTTKESPQLYHQWAQMYHLGFQLFPGMAVTTLVLYGYIVMKKRAAKRPWAIFAVAGAVTVAMLPFTWIFMAPTNNVLFDLEAKSKSAVVTGIVEAQSLLRKWRLLHIARSIFPLAGAVIGLSATLSGRH